MAPLKYEVRVKFRKDFVKMEEGKLIVGVRAKPENGEANEEIVAKIGRFFGVPKSRVALVAGHRSKKKIVEIR